MKTTLLRHLALLSATLAFAGSLGAAVVGQAAPDFTLTDIHGTTHRLSDFKGKTVVLEWINPECPFVVHHYGSGNIPALQKSTTAEGVVWLAINSGKPGAQGDFAPEKAAAWLAEKEAAPTAYLRDPDGTVGRKFGAKTTPHMYVINPEGKLVYNGAIDSIPSTRKADLARAENYVLPAVAAARTGGMPARTESQPYGCGVKY